MNMKYLDKNELEYLLGIEDLSKNKNHSIGLIVNNIYDKLNNNFFFIINSKFP